MRRLGFGGELLAAELEAPTASLQNGAAGFAYALLRLACAGDDEELLALADVWSQRARSVVRLPAAFINEELEITPATFGTISLSHCETGVHFTDALVASARWDDGVTAASIGEFIRCLRQPSEHLDVSFGASGNLVGCALLHAALRVDQRADVLLAGDELSARLLAAIEEHPPIPEDTELRMLGVAHGWGGLLYSVLLWAEATDAKPPASVEERLDELAALGVRAGRGLLWPAAVGGEPDGLSSSWCNGAAGLTHLWALAHRHSGDSKHATLAERAAWAAVEAPDGIADLCCGLAGRAYAALAAYKLTRDEAWLTRAYDLTQRAAVSVRRYALRRDSLYKGELGIAVLAAELQRPLESCMPAFEADGWASEPRRERPPGLAQPRNGSDGREHR